VFLLFHWQDRQEPVPFFSYLSFSQFSPLVENDYRQVLQRSLMLLPPIVRSLNKSASSFFFLLCWAGPERKKTGQHKRKVQKIFKFSELYLEKVG
jgi:hypothetical protein